MHLQGFEPKVRRWVYHGVRQAQLGLYTIFECICVYCGATIGLPRVYTQSHLNIVALYIYIHIVHTVDHYRTAHYTSAHTIYHGECR